MNIYIYIYIYIHIYIYLYKCISDIHPLYRSPLADQSRHTQLGPKIFSPKAALELTQARDVTGK